MPQQLMHEPDAQRYVLRVDDELVSVLEYRVSGQAVSFTRTYTNPRYRGRGFASVVTEFAVDDVERTSERRIVPMCWYVGQWFDQHPERAGLLTR